MTPSTQSCLRAPAAKSHTRRHLDIRPCQCGIYVPLSRPLVEWLGCVKPAFRPEQMIDIVMAGPADRQEIGHADRVVTEALAFDRGLPPAAEGSWAPCVIDGDPSAAPSQPSGGLSFA